MNNKIVAETGSKVAHAAPQSVMDELVEPTKEPEIQYKTLWIEQIYAIFWLHRGLARFQRGRKMLEIAGGWINNIKAHTHPTLCLSRKL
jgi:hypothetical protein